jgi:hypothetical protein
VNDVEDGILRAKERATGPDDATGRPWPQPHSRIITSLGGPTIPIVLIIFAIGALLYIVVALASHTTNTVAATIISTFCRALPDTLWTVDPGGQVWRVAEARSRTVCTRRPGLRPLAERSVEGRPRWPSGKSDAASIGPKARRPGTCFGISVSRPRSSARRAGL